MVAILRCTPGEAKFLGSRKRQEQLDAGWESVGERDEWKSRHVVLVVTGQERGRPRVEYVGQARCGRPAGTFRRVVEVTQLHRVAPPVPMEDLSDQLPLRHRDAVDRSGVLTKRSGEELLNALTTLRADLAAVIAQLQERVGGVRILGRVRELFLEQRDATGLALQLGGFDRSIIEEAKFPEEGGDQIPVFATLPGHPAHEDHLVAHDAQRFSDWIGSDAEHLAKRVFHKGDQQLFIANVNRLPAEDTLGVDLIYHHVSRDSFILVQYKKMVQVGAGRREWGYRPDGDLDDQLKRMRQVEEACMRLEQDPPADYRFVHQPCWIKFCKSEQVAPKGDALIGGMYLTREHVEWLRGRPGLATGPKGGELFGYHTVPRYLDNTTFTQLVQDGWIGTRGRASDIIQAQIKASLDGSRALVFAGLIGDDTTQAERTRERRGGLTG
ncbi:hypothetical protein [Streptomyces asoensis]|uniref:NERD domain-containing protein n=2 Tax=Streptomyces TaxID=1883 RepID=A0ABQ3S973_9ACTN|nr:hypothetical protein [Streptomyces asoensis]GGQ83122.1 hypothetical protein GCM10010496_53350 [Streptomyces asoensis]GHI64502.1 hypothetical protein Saso_61520 [Streptomyces asoensis]